MTLCQNVYYYYSLWHSASCFLKGGGEEKRFKRKHDGSMKNSGQIKNQIMMVVFIGGIHEIVVHLCTSSNL